MKIHTVKNTGTIIGNYAIKDEAVIMAAVDSRYSVEETELFGVDVDIDCLYCWKLNNDIVILDEHKGRFVASVEVLTFPAGKETVLDDIRINGVDIERLEITNDLRKDIKDFVDKDIFELNNQKLKL